MIKLKDPKTGHRQRLREKFFQNGLDGFLDYEVVELLLTLGTPRKDCKLMAKNLVAKFGSLKNVIDADITQLASIAGVGQTSSIGMTLFKNLMKRYSLEKARGRNQLDNANDIAGYLQQKIGTSNKEKLYVLYLDTQSKLIDVEVSVGILNANIIHPREVFEAAITQHASHIVIAHNHPSGDTTPSDADIANTRRLVEAGKIVGIEVIDHLIVSRNAYASFRELGLI